MAGIDFTPAGVDTLLERIRGPLVRHRFGALACWDAAFAALAIFVSTWVRYELDLTDIDPVGMLFAMPVAALIQFVAGRWQGLYLGRWRLGSFEEVAALLRSVAVAMVGMFVVNLVWYWVPISVPLIAMLATLVGMAGLRYAWRLAVQRRRRPGCPARGRAIVFGAGEGAEQVLTATLRDPDSPYLPVAIVDDDPGKRHLRIRGVPVEGTREDIVAIAERHGCDTLLLAIPSADSALIRTVADIAAAADLQVLALPPPSSLFGPVGLSDIRPLTDADLLGRHSVDTDIEAVAGYLTDRVVLVTGAGGSIGSELCRQIHRFAPRRLVLLDHDESAIHACQLSLDGRGQLDSPDLVVASIRDRDRIMEIFAEVQPEVVFHAAALKHVPLLEMHPYEAMKTNVQGTQNCLDAAAAVGVQHFVNISTDKAAEPINVLGRTKRIAEQLTAGMATQADGTYLSVRFGNVLGSRGSVLTTFRAQIEAGGPVTVTHREVTRYFMTVEESVQLVIQAGAIGRDGEVLVLDMGEPVRIAEVAERMIAASGKRIDIVYTGLRPGEKVHEVLLAVDEIAERRVHPSISHVCVPPLLSASDSTDAILTGSGQG